MFEPSKTIQVTREINRYKLDILGISETRWTANAKSKTSDGTVILHSGHKDKHIHGVVLMISKK